MDYNQKFARLAGLLFLLQLVPYYIAHERILGALLYTPDFLQNLHSSRTQVATAVVLELLSAFAFVGFSIILYQAFRVRYPRLSNLYIGLRFVEFGIIVLSEIKMMALVGVSRQWAQAEPNAAEFLHSLGQATLLEWEWTTLVYMMVFSVNALFFYALLFRTRLAPRFIAIWGGAGALLALSAPLLLLYGQPSGGMLLYAPIGLNELFLAIWLLTRGFSTPYPPAEAQREGGNL